MIHPFLCSLKLHVWLFLFKVFVSLFWPVIFNLNWIYDRVLKAWGSFNPFKERGVVNTSFMTKVFNFLNHFLVSNCSRKQARFSRDFVKAFSFFRLLFTNYMNWFLFTRITFLWVFMIGIIIVWSILPRTFTFEFLLSTKIELLIFVFKLWNEFSGKRIFNLSVLDVWFCQILLNILINDSVFISNLSFLFFLI